MMPIIKTIFNRRQQNKFIHTYMYDREQVFTFSLGSSAFEQ
jgi:hypothetical protein